MELKYRGVAYQPSAPSLEAPSLEGIGIFRGSRYEFKRYSAQARMRVQAPLELTYRGVRYSR